MSNNNLMNPTKPMAAKLFSQFIEKTPELSFGESLFSILRGANLPELPENVEVSWLKTISDDDLFAAIERAIINDTQEEKTEA